MCQIEKKKERGEEVVFYVSFGLDVNHVKLLNSMNVHSGCYMCNLYDFLPPYFLFDWSNKHLRIYNVTREVALYFLLCTNSEKAKIN